MARCAKSAESLWEDHWDIRKPALAARGPRKHTLVSSAIDCFQRRLDATIMRKLSMQSVLPDSIPSSLWEEFRKHRKRLRAPMTEHCETLVLCKLEKWRVECGANPIDVINESIERGWRGIFLNGHGKAQPLGKESTGVISVNSAEPVCCSCKGSLDGGFIYTRGGRKCHNC